MATTKTIYVRLSHRYVTRPRERMVPAVFVSDDPADGHPMAGDVALYEVECRTKHEAHDILTHWLALGRPGIMRVQETYRPKADR